MRQTNTTSSTIILRADRVMSDVTVYAKQYDSQSRFINIDLRDDGGRIYGTNIIQLNALRPGCKYSYIRGTQDENGIIHFELTSQILALPGNVLCDVSLFDYSAPETVFEYGTGAKKEFALMRRFYKIDQITVGGASVANYEYDSKSGILVFQEAPGANARIDITGEGIQLLTSALFTIVVEKSCYNDKAIAASDEFLTVAEEILKAQDILYEAEQKLTGIIEPIRHKYEEQSGLIIAIENHHEYYLYDSSATFTYPSGYFECYIYVEFQGSAELIFPSWSSYAGSIPYFTEDTTWEIRIKNGIISAMQVI